MSDIKDYLNKETIFKRSVIVKDTHWDNGAMSKWLSGEQGIPTYREEEIKDYMTPYGMYHDEMVEALVNAKKSILSTTDFTLKKNNNAVESVKKINQLLKKIKG